MASWGIVNPPEFVPFVIDDRKFKELLAKIAKLLYVHCCVRHESSSELAGNPILSQANLDSPAIEKPKSPMYRVLRSGRKRPWRSVDRETVGRNASEAIESRHMNNVSVGVEVLQNSEDNTETRKSLGPTGIEGHGMQSKFAGERGRSTQVETEIEVREQGLISEQVQTPGVEVGWNHSSEEVG